MATGLGLLPVAAAQDGDVDLRPQFQAGRTTRYQLWYERQVSTTINFQGKSQSVGQQFHYDGEMTWHVDEVAKDGSATCTLTIDWLALTTSVGGTKQTHDTRKRSGETPALHQYLKAMTDKPLRFSVSPVGTVQKVEGVQAIRSETPKELASAVMDEQFTEMAYDLALLPEAPQQARAGRRWSFRFRSLHELGWVKEDSTFTFAGVEDIAGVPVATVNASDKVSFEPRLPELPPGAPKVNIRMTAAKGSKQILWDVLRHEAIGRNSTQSRAFQVHMTYQGQTITRTIEEESQQQVLRIAED